MKNVVLSADGDRKVYSVPDVVADNLEKYCMEFCTKWLWESPDAEKYRTGSCVYYNEDDFIEYLNTWLFPDEKSVLIKNLRWIDIGDTLPKPFDKCPKFNF